MFIKVNKELLDDIISQEVDFYQVSLNDTEANIYGETPTGKVYYQPIRLTCLIERGDQSFNVDDQIGVDASQIYTFKFLRQTLVDLNLWPEVGDLVENRGNFYEIDSINENQFVLGKDPSYNKNVSIEYGESISIIAAAHYTRVTKLHLTEGRGGSNV